MSDPFSTCFNFTSNIYPDYARYTYDKYPDGLCINGNSYPTIYSIMTQGFGEVTLRKYTSTYTFVDEIIDTSVTPNIFVNHFMSTLLFYRASSVPPYECLIGHISGYTGCENGVYLLTNQESFLNISANIPSDIPTIWPNQNRCFYFTNLLSACQASLSYPTDVLVDYIYYKQTGYKTISRGVSNLRVSYLFALQNPILVRVRFPNNENWRTSGTLALTATVYSAGDGTNEQFEEIPRRSPFMTPYATPAISATFLPTPFATPTQTSTTTTSDETSTTASDETSTTTSDETSTTTSDETSTTTSDETSTTTSDETSTTTSDETSTTTSDETSTTTSDETSTTTSDETSTTTSDETSTTTSDETSTTTSEETSTTTSDETSINTETSSIETLSLTSVSNLIPTLKRTLRYTPFPSQSHYDDGYEGEPYDPNPITVAIKETHPPLQTKYLKTDVPKLETVAAAGVGSLLIISIIVTTVAYVKRAYKALRFHRDVDSDIAEVDSDDLHEMYESFLGGDEISITFSDSNFVLSS